MEDEERKRKVKVHHWYQHFKRRREVRYNIIKISSEIERLLKWKEALNKRWSFHRHREFD